MAQTIGLIATLLKPCGVYAIGGKPLWPALSINDTHIKHLVKNSVTVMDKVTYEILGCLDETVTIVVDDTCQPLMQYILVNTCDDAIIYAETHYPEKKIFFMGGGNIWECGMEFAEEIYLTWVSFSKNSGPVALALGPIDIFHAPLNLGPEWQVTGMQNAQQKILQKESDTDFQIINLDFVNYKRVDKKDMVVQD